MNKPTTQTTAPTTMTIKCHSYYTGYAFPVTFTITPDGSWFRVTHRHHSESVRYATEEAILEGYKWLYRKALPTDRYLN